MAANHTLDLGLLDELRGLESFRRNYSSSQGIGVLDPQDPDVQRLIEVLAFSAVRTRHAVMRNLSATWRRLLGGYFQSLLQPLPAMGILEAQVTARMTEPVYLPAGSELQVQCADGFLASFMTRLDLRVLPLTLDRCELLRGGTGYRLVLTFSSRIPRSEPPGRMRLGIHYLDDYLAALTVHQQLQRHMQRAFVLYDQPVHDRADGPTCPVHFGTYHDEPYEADDRNPLAAVRSFLHFPQQELTIHVAIPASPRPFTRMSLCFDLDADYPHRPVLYREIFRPFTVPISALRKAPAQPIDCNGTQDSYPVRFVHPDQSYALHHITGVFAASDDGLVPIPPVTLSNKTPSFELEQQSDERGSLPRAALILRMPEALLQPVRIAVEGVWHQPSLSEHLSGRLSITLRERSMLGVELSALGPMQRGADSQLGQDAAALLRLLSLKMKAVLDLEDLNALFVMLEAGSSGPYRGFLSRIRDWVVEQTPDETVRGAGIRHIYHALVPDVRAEEEPLWHMFCQQLQRLLDAWNYEGRAEVVRHHSREQLPSERQNGR